MQVWDSISLNNLSPDRDKQSLEEEMPLKDYQVSYFMAHAGAGPGPGRGSDFAPNNLSLHPMY